MAITLPTVTDLNNVFGSVNVNNWADVNNNADDTEIATRVTWAILMSSQYVLGRLVKKYDVGLWTTFPTIPFDLVVRRACVELYRHPRGMVDGNESDAAMMSINLEVESKIDQLLSGQLELMDIDEEPRSVPGINNFTQFNSQRFRNYDPGAATPQLTDLELLIEDLYTIV